LEAVKGLKTINSISWLANEVFARTKSANGNGSCSNKVHPSSATAQHISMDGRGRALDNIFVERLWRTVKYEDIYLKEYATVLGLLAGLTGYFAFHNDERLYQCLGYRTPAEDYFGC
jgi:transposase InsO family protein